MAIDRIFTIGPLCWALGTFGCRTDPPAAEIIDSGVPLDARVTDASMLGDAAQPLGWVDFAISGCASGDGSEASPCIGTSPLVLRFTLLAPAIIDNQLWDFGDGSDNDASLSPQHRFAVPGSYDLTLNVEGPGGTAGVTRLAAIAVIPAPLTAQCSEDSHCASGDCACEESSDCPALLAGGICVLSCQSHTECGGNRCINLDPTGLATASWQQVTCLPSCQDDSECDAGKQCQAMLDVDGILEEVCFAPGLLLPLGHSCADPNGDVDDARCASGLCLDIGDHGVCAATCDELSCPNGSVCATFDIGLGIDPHCLADCENIACENDPSLECQQPGVGFSIDQPANPTGYCAPISS